MRSWRRLHTLAFLAACALACGCGGAGRSAVARGHRAATQRAGAGATYGDLNGNAAIDAADATKILRVVVKLDPDLAAADLWTMDLNGNGQVDAADATKLLRVVVGLDPALALPSRYAPVSQPTPVAGSGKLRGSVQKKLKGSRRRDAAVVSPTGVWLSTGGALSFYQTCDPQGNFVFDNVLPGGSLLVTAASPGFGQASTGASVVAGAEQTLAPLALEAGADTAGALQGYVFDSAGRPVANAFLQLRGTDRCYTTTTDGYFLFVGVPAATYDLAGYAGGQWLQAASVVVSAGQSTVVDLHLGVVPSQPRVTATVGAASAVVGQTVGFSGTATPGGTAGTIVSYQWDFGDGQVSPPSTSSPEAVHVYTQAGVYRAVLTAVDSLGNGGAGWVSLEVVAPASLAVTLMPPDAVAAGATWSLDGAGAYPSGMLLENVAAGVGHTLHCNPAAGFRAPADQTLTFAAGELKQLEVAYVPVVPVTVTLTPSVVVSAGARWRLDGDAGHASGETVHDVEVGSHLLSYTDVSGFQTPVSMPLNLVAGQPFTTTVNYYPQTGAVRVLCAPTTARWTLDADAKQHASGEVVGGVAPGSHIIHGALATGYLSPTDTLVTVAGGTQSDSTLAWTPLKSTLISAGGEFSLAVRPDRTVAAWGNNIFGQTNVPTDLADVVAVSAGNTFALALKADGTVRAWGNNYSGQCNVPPNLVGVTAISAGGDHSLALTADGLVVAWGGNANGQALVPSTLLGVAAVAAGDQYSLALKRDGTLDGWGDNYYGQRNVPTGVSGFAGLSCGAWHSLALKADGTVSGQGDNSVGESAAQSGAVAVAAGLGFSLALKADGTVFGWGHNDYGQVAVPAGLQRAVAVEAGGHHSLALQADGTVVAWGSNASGQCDVPAGLVVNRGLASRLLRGLLGR